MTAYSTGLRVSEIVARRTADIDRDRLLIRVRAGNREPYTDRQHALNRIVKVTTFDDTAHARATAGPARQYEH